MTRTVFGAKQSMAAVGAWTSGRVPCGYEQKDRAAMQLPQRSALCAGLNE